MTGNTSALNREFLTRLRGFIRRRVRSDHDAEDIMQDVLTKFVQHDDSINAQSVHAWMFTVARRAIIDRSRSLDNRPQTEVTDAIVSDPPDEPSASTELARCVEPMLEALSRSDRTLLKRVDMQGESQADVAHELGMSMSGVKSRVQRARSRLRELLEDCCQIERDPIGQPADYHRRPDRPCPCDRCE